MPQQVLGAVKSQSCEVLRHGNSLQPLKEVAHVVLSHTGVSGHFSHAVNRTKVLLHELSCILNKDLLRIRNTDFANVRTLYGAHSAEQVASTNDTDRPALLPAGAEPLDYILTELAAIPLRGVEAAMPKHGETAIVIGQGLIGSLSAKWLLLAGLPGDRGGHGGIPP